MKSRAPLTLLAALILLTGILTFAGGAAAQLAIYRLEFDKTGPSINYGFYDEGYVIADAAGGPATWLLTFRDEETLQNQFITIEEFGSLFYANKGDLTRAVISAAAATGTPQTTFLLIGDLTRDVESDNITVEVAGNLSGFAISADDESGLPFDSREGNIGYAGASEIKGSFQTDRSDAASRDRLTIADALADIVEMFESRGFTEFTAVDPAATTAASGTATAAANGTTATGITTGITTGNGTNTGTGNGTSTANGSGTTTSNGSGTTTTNTGDGTAAGTGIVNP